MKKLSKVLVLFGCMLFSGSSFSSEGSGKVKIDHVGGFGSGNLVFFYTDSVDVDTACNTVPRWVLNLNTEAGKAQYSLILSAQISGKAVKVRGNKVCSLWPDSEDIHNIGFMDY